MPKRATCSLVVVTCLFIASAGLRAAPFIRGDADQSGPPLTITDAIQILGHLFLGSPGSFDCFDAVDADDNGAVNLTDAIQILNHLFRSGSPPPAPFPDCGEDPTADGLECIAYARCVDGNGFLSLQLAAGEQTPIRQLTTQLELLKAIMPDASDNQLVGQPASTTVLGKLAPERLLVLESRNRALISAELCPECSANRQGAEITLHYNREGLNVEFMSPAATGVSINRGVAPVELELGGKRWLVAYENSSRSLIAFRYDPGFRPVPGMAPTGSKNFGRGNGLIANVVIKGSDIGQEIGARSPRITRIFPLNSEQFLVFFSSVSGIYLLDLSVTEVSADWDLDNDSPGTVRPTATLTGSFFTAGPLVEQLAIQRLTRMRGGVDLDGFPPILVPNDGAALLFDDVSTCFILVDEVGGLRLPACLGGVLGGRNLGMRGSWYHPAESLILVVEERNNDILAYAYEEPDGTRNVEVFVPSQALRARLDPREGRVVNVVEEPLLVVSRNDVRDNRLIFDRGRDELLAINYDTRAVVIVARRTDFLAATNGKTADLSFMESLATAAPSRENVRGWDLDSNSLLELRLSYVTLEAPDPPSPGPPPGPGPGPGPRPGPGPGPRPGP